MVVENLLKYNRALYESGNNIIPGNSCRNFLVDRAAELKRPGFSNDKVEKWISCAVRVPWKLSLRRTATFFLLCSIPLPLLHCFSPMFSPSSFLRAILPQACFFSCFIEVEEFISIPEELERNARYLELENFSELSRFRWDIWRTL